MGWILIQNQRREPGTRLSQASRLAGEVAGGWKVGLSEVPERSSRLSHVTMIEIVAWIGSSAAAITAQVTSFFLLNRKIK